MTETQTLAITRTIDLLGDADPDVRLRAALDLGTWNATEAASALVDRLGRERLHPIRETLSWAVLRMPEAARPALVRALSSDRWLARMQACHVVSKLGDPADAPLIQPLIADEVDAVASRAWWAVAQARLSSLGGDLAGQLGRGDSELRNSLSIALVELGEAATAPLVGVLREGTRDAREHAADTLGLLGSPPADPAGFALFEAMDDPDPGVRFAALNALGQIDTRLARRALEDAATSSEVRLAELSRRFLAASRADTPPSGEETAIGRLARFEGATAGAPQAVAPWTPGIGARISWTGDPDRRLVSRLLVQVATCAPRYLSRADVPTEVLDAIRAEAAQNARAQGKPDTVVDRIAAGRVETFLHETVLLEQVSVADPGVLIDDLLRGTGVHVTGFARIDADVSR